MSITVFMRYCFVAFGIRTSFFLCDNEIMSEWVKQIKIIAIALFVVAILFCLLYACTSESAFLTLSITFGTTAYHFLMRLIIGFLLGNVLPLPKRWIKVSKAERKLYSLMKVKRWKAKLPTARPSSFDIRKKEAKKIYEASLRAEIGHEIIIILSFAPLFLCAFFGATNVFLLTSIFSTICDIPFVIIQRYNRPRYLKMIAFD